MGLLGDLGTDCYRLPAISSFISSACLKWFPFGYGGCYLFKTSSGKLTVESAALHLLPGALTDPQQWLQPGWRTSPDSRPPGGMPGLLHWCPLVGDAHCHLRGPASAGASRLHRVQRFGLCIVLDTAVPSALALVSSCQCSTQESRQRWHFFLILYNLTAKYGSGSDLACSVTASLLLWQHFLRVY